MTDRGETGFVVGADESSKLRAFARRPRWWRPRKIYSNVVCGCSSSGTHSPTNPYIDPAHFQYFLTSSNRANRPIVGYLLRN